MNWKDAITQGQKDFNRMVQNLVCEIERLKKENARLQRRIEKLSKCREEVDDGEP